MKPLFFSKGGDIMKMTVTLTQEEVEEIIKKHLETKFKTVGKIKLEVGEQWVGHGPNEHRTPAFKGATTEVEL